MNLDIAHSYLQARDPSIISYNRTNLEKVKMNLVDLMETKSAESDVEEKTEENKFMNVYLRIRGDIKMNDIYKIDDNNLSCRVPEGSYSLRNVKYGDSMKRTYTFTKIFDQQFDQKTIFDYIVKPKLVSFINGRNSTLFTYGASGSGKTYTIVGTPEEPGFIPRALEYVFKSLSKVSLQPEIKPLPNGKTQNMTEELLSENERYKNLIVNATLCNQAAHIKTYQQMQSRLSSEPIAEVTDNSDVCVSAWISFTEIYNENIYDLLCLPNSKNKVRTKLALGKSEGNTYVKKLTYLHVSDGLEAYQILQYGLHNLNYAATAVNSHSSRSHCIFTIKLVQSSKNNSDVYISNFNFCDLAGSEKLKKTMNFGDRLKESNNINTSLLVLGRCMENIKKCQQVKDNRLIPFRESKLTQIFQNALLGYENVEMIVNVNPSKDMFDETIHVLNFSAIANTIIIEEELPKPVKKENRFSLMMRNDEKVKDNKKIVISDNRNMETLQAKIYELQKNCRRLQQENQNLISKLQESVNDPNEEIRRLNDAIDMLIEERDNIIAKYEEKIEEEKDSVARAYKESMDRIVEMYEEGRKQALARQREEYEKMIAEMQTITISSDEEESPQKLNGNHRKQLDEKLKYYIKLTGELKDQLESTEGLLEDAKEEYRSSQLEIKRITQENNDLKSEVVRLRETIDATMLLHQSMNFFHDNSSGVEDEDSHESV